MGLDDECEWPDVGPYYCWSCAHGVIAEQSQLITDLAMLVRRLVAEKQVVKKAKEFLVRKGLQGSPLRDSVRLTQFPASTNPLLCIKVPKRKRAT